MKKTIKEGDSQPSVYYSFFISLLKTYANENSHVKLQWGFTSN